MPCDKCDSPGGQKTYENQACLPLGGKLVCIDWCIHRIVAALNAAGLETAASCCGHGRIDGRIDLKDGNVLFIVRSEPDKMIFRSPPERLKLLEEALQNIAEPVTMLSRQASEGGCELNGQAAIILSQDAEFLRNIAKEALASSGANDKECI